ncbi:MAG: hypothetical protein ACSLE3_06485 [Microbacteriaceae bacterium]
MPTPGNPATVADDAHRALRALAHETRSLDDPREIYSVLGSLTSAVASLSQSLHQLAAFHDASAKEVAWVAADTNASRATRYEVSWELHRAADILRHVGESIDSAHSAESRVTYTHRDFPAFADAPARSTGHGLSL